MTTAALPEVLTLDDARAGEPLAAVRQAELVEAFHRDGLVLMPGVLAGRAEALRQALDRLYADERLAASRNRVSVINMVRLFEHDNAFRDLLALEPFVSIAEAVVGVDCHIIAQNSIRNQRGEHSSHWHVDDHLYFPLPEGIDGFDPRVRMPIDVITVQVLLSDVPTVAHGPTQIVPGSHYSGRRPRTDAVDEPSYRGRGLVSAVGRAGDCYLHTGQVWHRAAPNLTERTRYLLSWTYSQRWVSQRFNPYIDYRMPDEVWTGASERLQRVLGRHTRGPYG